MKHSFEQSRMVPTNGAAHSQSSRAGTRDGDRGLRLHPAVGVVCPGCGARIGKPCVATVPLCGVGVVGVPIEGVHTERIAAAREGGLA